MKAQFLPLFNVNLSQLQLNSISTKLRLNFISTSFQPQVQINLSLNINLNSTSTITSTQYGCDIKATQSCYQKKFPQTDKGYLLVYFQTNPKQTQNNGEASNKLVWRKHDKHMLRISLMAKNALLGPWAFKITYYFKREFIIIPFFTKMKNILQILSSQNQGPVPW